MSGLAKQMMGGGTSFGQAKAMNGSVATGITTAGTTQGTATVLNAAVNVLATVAGGATGAILPSCEVADEVMVFNGDGADTAVIYPDSGSSINNLSANAGVNLAPATAIIFKRVTSTRWIAMLSA